MKNWLTWAALAAALLKEILAPSPAGETHLAIAPLAVAGIGAGVNLLGGLFGKKKGATSSESVTSTELGGLPPELQALLMQLMQQGGDVSSAIAGEVTGLPEGLSLEALSGSPFGNLGEEILRSSGLTPGVQSAFDEATQGSFDLARKNLEEELDLLEGRAGRQTDAALSRISGALGASGVRGGTPGAGAIARTVADVDASLKGAIQGGQATLGALGVENLRTRAQGLLTAQGLSQQGRLGVGNLLLGARGQSISLRQLADANRQLLLANPLTNTIFNRELATSTTTQRTKGTNAGAGGVTEALGGIGGKLLESGLSAYLNPAGG